MNRDKLYVNHILECIVRIERYVQAGEASFRADQLIQDAVVRNLQVLAESTQRLSQASKSSQPSIPWGKISNFRNVVVHDYFNVDYDVVWEIIRQDLPSLKAAIAAIQKNLP